mgnify:CR=1 FL=1
MLYTLRQDDLYYSRYPKDKIKKDYNKVILFCGGIIAYGFATGFFLSLSYYITLNLFNK